jgi:hypothetical protein
MKFSILALLVVIGYVAILFAAVAQPLSRWQAVSVFCWLLIVAYLGSLAFDRFNAGKAIFGRASCVFGAFYLLMSFWQDNDRTTWNVLPHQQLVRWWSEIQREEMRAQNLAPGAFGNVEINLGMIRQETINPLAILNCALAFGLLVACLALWRHRRNEKAKLGTGEPCYR